MISELYEKIKDKFPCELINGQLLINGDCEKVLPLISDVDCVITDPPYNGIVKNKWDNQWKNNEEFGKWSANIGDLIYKATKDNASFYWFGDDKNIAYSQVELDKQWRLLNSVVWEKTMHQTMKGAESVYRSYAPITERCLFYDKGEDMTGLEMIDRDYIAPRNPFAKELRRARLKKGVSINQVAEYGKFYGNVNHGGAVTNWEKGYNVPLKEQWDILRKNLPIKLEYENLRLEYENLRRAWNNHKKAFDVLKFGICQDKGRFHDTQKPLDLITYLIERSSRKGDVILDCFAGSFTTAIASYKTGRQSICIELDEEYYSKGVERVRKETQQLEMF
jgi:site-specific DNA-methyltransferase (adenine-specific)